MPDISIRIVSIWGWPNAFMSIGGEPSDCSVRGLMLPGMLAPVAAAAAAAAEIAGPPFSIGGPGRLGWMTVHAGEAIAS